jgi:hypothetical protein
MRKNSIYDINEELIKQAYSTLPMRNYDDNVIKLLELNLTKLQYVKIALHLSQRTYIGFYSTLFNKIARANLTPEFLASLPYWDDKDFFPELYNNENITSDEKAEILDHYTKELEALFLAYSLHKETSQKFFRKDGESNLPDFETDDLYSQSYNQICIVNNFKNANLKDVNQVTFSSPITHQIITEEHKTYCLPIKELLKNNQLIKRSFPIEFKLIEYANTSIH